MNKVILITGGSQGIGASTAHLAAMNGYRVCINYHQNKSAADDVVRKIANDGGEAVSFKADVSNEAEVEKLFSFIDSELGEITALVNNAGVIESQMRFVDMTGKRLQNTFNKCNRELYVCTGSYQTNVCKMEWHWRKHCKYFINCCTSRCPI